jgi:ribonucrease Y
LAPDVKYCFKINKNTNIRNLDCYEIMIENPFVISTLGLAIAFVLLFTFTLITKRKPNLNEENQKIKESLEQEYTSYKQNLETEFKTKQEHLRHEVEKDNEVIISNLKLQAIAELKEEEKQMRNKMMELQESFNQKENVLQEKLDKIELERNQVLIMKTELLEFKEKVIKKQENLEQQEAQQQIILETKLSEIAGLSKERAKQEIAEQVKYEMGGELLDWQKKLLEAAQEDAVSKAREIVAQAIQRCSSEVANEFTITTIKLPDEDAKGKIIGKGGRNIQWLEKTLGVELVIDETPEIVTISGFNSIRRHIAKKTLEKLLEDGRIHPSSIEDMYEKSKAEIAQEIAEAGQDAVNELGIYDFPAKLVRIIGRLKFRTSYGQNMLRHSVEMAKLAQLLAQEMNSNFPHRKPIDVDICVKGALLHDIGKAVDEETIPKGNHIELGEKVCEMFDLDWRIKKCVSSHHDESYFDPEHGFCIEAALVDACDNISGGRLGARKETAEAYYQRMEALEKIADTTPGVTKSWIMRGSRELWVFFDTNAVSPDQMHQTTREIAQRIQTDVKYPGEIKIIGLWEDKIVEYAS